MATDSDGDWIGYRGIVLPGNWRCVVNETELTGIELLRYAVKLFNGCRESCNEQYTAEQLLNIAKAMRRSEWDIMPDEWTSKQRFEASCKGKVPSWTEIDGELVPR